MRSELNNFVGEHQIRNIDGSVAVYKKGDVVTQGGNLYIATRTTQGYDPRHGSSAGWEEYSSEIKFTNSDIVPSLPNEGDVWFNTSTGILYVFISDKNTKQWVET